MQAGGYTLHLACDADGCRNQAEFYGELGTSCRREARLAGWKLGRTSGDLCPEHSGKPDRRSPATSELAWEVI